MANRIIKNGDDVYATGVNLRRDNTVKGGWVVMGFEDDTYFNGELVESHETENEIVYYTGEMDF